MEITQIRREGEGDQELLDDCISKASVELTKHKEKYTGKVIATLTQNTCQMMLIEKSGEEDFYLDLEIIEKNIDNITD